MADPHSASFPWSQQVSQSYSFFYHITCTHMHRRTIQIQHVDLYDAYLLLFLIEILLSSSIRTQRYALKYARGFVLPINTAVKSKHLHGSSAPQTYSIICISS